MNHLPFKNIYHVSLVDTGMGRKSSLCCLGRGCEEGQDLPNPIPRVFSKCNYFCGKQEILARLEKALAPHSSSLAWKVPWTEEPDGLQSMGSLESDKTERLHFHFSLWCIGEGNGNPLQCSCPENPRDRGAWWAAVYGVTQSRTRLQQLSSSSS